MNSQEEVPPLGMYFRSVIAMKMRSQEEALSLICKNETPKTQQMLGAAGERKWELQADMGDSSIERQQITNKLSELQ